MVFLGSWPCLQGAATTTQSHCGACCHLSPVERGLVPALPAQGEFGGALAWLPTSLPGSGQSSSLPQGHQLPGAALQCAAVQGKGRCKGGFQSSGAAMAVGWVQHLKPGFGSYNVKSKSKIHQHSIHTVYYYCYCYYLLYFDIFCYLRDLLHQICSMSSDAPAAFQVFQSIANAIAYMEGGDVPKAYPSWTWWGLLEAFNLSHLKSMRW